MKGTSLGQGHDEKDISRRVTPSGAGRYRASQLVCPVSYVLMIKKTGSLNWVLMWTGEFLMVGCLICWLGISDVRYLFLNRALNF